ncbi:B3/4 domain-containing protein [Pseudomonas sp. NPDC088444]|uniref:B3/B4 domain-containing protein n=1 Tax=Pseudomonas sp. NPDC088444 TaxID=3364456 RepID=UPI00384FE022
MITTRKFKVNQDVFETFPDLKIAVLIVKGVDNSGPGREDLVNIAQERVSAKMSALEDLHPHVLDYSQAMKQIKRKKGCLASIEAMAKRIKKGESIGSVNPVVDVYNYVSLSHLFTCGGEDLDRIQGDMVLGFAKGDESFVPLGSDENSPPREGELIYHDDEGAVVRSWLWREADRTKITNDSRNILLYAELVNPQRVEEFQDAVQELKALMESELGGTVASGLITKDQAEYNFE